MPGTTPWKEILSAPAWAGKESGLGSVTVRLHGGLCRLLLLWATQRPLARRPVTARVNVSFTLAAVLSVSENVVPSGGRRTLALGFDLAALAVRLPALALRRAPAPPARQRAWDWETFERIGRTGGGTVLTTGGEVISGAGSCPGSPE